MIAKLHICSDFDLQSCVSGEKANVSKGKGIPSSSELVILSIESINTNQVTICGFINLSRNPYLSILLP